MVLEFHLRYYGFEKKKSSDTNFVKELIPNEGKVKKKLRVLLRLCSCWIFLNLEIKER